MTLQQLEYVIALDKYRHFVKAAESCFVSQPTISLQLQKLEEEIGIKIFERNITPLKPTSIGQDFINKVKDIMLQISQLRDIVTHQKNNTTGILKIGIIPSLSPYLLPLFIASFTSKHPNLFLDIEELTSLDIIQKLKDNSLDLALMSTPLEEKSLKEIFLFKEPFLVYANKQHPFSQKKELSPEDLTEKGLWLLKEGHCFRNQILEVCKLRTNINNMNFSFEANSIETLKNLIRTHSGYTLIPEMSVNPNDTDYIIPFKSDYIPSREISIVTNKSFNKILILDSLRKEILDKIPENYAKNDYFIRVDWR